MPKEEAQRLYANIPARLRPKTTKLKAAKKRQAEFVAFIAEGRGTKAVGAAPAEFDLRVERLEQQVAGLQCACNKVIRAPSLR